MVQNAKNASYSLDSYTGTVANTFTVTVVITAMVTVTIGIGIGTYDG